MKVSVRIRMEVCAIVLSKYFMGCIVHKIMRHLERARGLGAVAQLEERLICIQQVIGSNPFGSTIIKRAHSSVG